MTTASTVVSIPLYPGVKGDLFESPWTKDGGKVNGKVHWVVPLEIQFPDGWAIFNTSVVPALQNYTGKFEFEIYDKYQLAVPKYMGKVIIDSTDDTYEIQLEQRYHCYRLTMMLTVFHTPQEPNETNAYRVGVPYGDWRYKDVI
jgi:hypothetical protein